MEIWAFFCAKRRKLQRECNISFVYSEIPRYTVFYDLLEFLESGHGKSDHLRDNIPRLLTRPSTVAHEMEQAHIIAQMKAPPQTPISPSKMTTARANLLEKERTRNSSRLYCLILQYDRLARIRKIWQLCTSMYLVIKTFKLLRQVCSKFENQLIAKNWLTTKFTRPIQLTYQ